MADFSDIAINTTAQRIEIMANMDINSAGIDENSNDFSLPTSKVVFDFVSANGGEGSSDSVLYTEQNLTKDQQAQARENIDALGKVEEYVTTISPTEDSVMEGYIGPDGLVAKAPAYRCTDYIAIDFDDNSVVNIHGTFAGYAGTVFYDTNKKVLLVVNGHNITNYGESLINTAEWTQTAPVTLPVGVAFVRMTIATKDYTKPEDLWITGKKTANVIDMLKNIIAMVVKNATVSYEKQTLTPEQQAQARENIGAVGIETFEAEMGIMSDVLDELHNYAQALIGGEA